MHTYTVEPLYVPSGEETIAADFYLPKTNIKPAVILMAHGFAGLRQFKLVQYAQRFAKAGYAVILFDSMPKGAGCWRAGARCHRR